MLMFAVREFPCTEPDIVLNLRSSASIASLSPASADVLRSIETSMEGGSAHTCVADPQRIAQSRSRQGARTHGFVQRSHTSDRVVRRAFRGPGAFAGWWVFPLSRSRASASTRLALLPWSGAEPDNRPDWFLAISPHKKVPVLRVDDRVSLFESNAIAEYLDETVPPRLHSS
jgi:Glutathione S-transferase, N-terminal domain